MNDEPFEADLIRQAVAGDRSSLSQLLLRHYDELHRHVALRLTGDLQGIWPVEDVLQDVFVKAAVALPTFEDRGTGSFGAWLKTIASNRIKDAQKRRRRERRAPPEAAADSSVPALVEGLAGDVTSPSRQVRHADRNRQLLRALAGLPSEQREVLRRYYLEEQSLDQIAAAMSRTKHAIRGICFRARRSLRLILGHSSQFLSG